MWQWVLDNNCNGKGVASTTPSCASDMGVGGNSAALNDTPVNTGIRANAGYWEYDNGGITASDRLLFSSSGNYTSSKNAGQLTGPAAGGVLRGGRWVVPSASGLFAANMSSAPSTTSEGFGFRCAFQP